jgi:hypothetical protein
MFTISLTVSDKRDQNDVFIVSCCVKFDRDVTGAEGGGSIPVRCYLTATLVSDRYPFCEAPNSMRYSICR